VVGGRVPADVELEAVPIAAKQFALLPRYYEPLRHPRAPACPLTADGRSYAGYEATAGVL
jgi:hypothetical protein